MLCAARTLSSAALSLHPSRLDYTAAHAPSTVDWHSHHSPLTPPVLPLPSPPVTRPDVLSSLWPVWPDPAPDLPQHSHPFGGLPTLSHLSPSSLLKFLHSDSISDFHFVIGETPLSTWATPLTVIPLYLLAILLTQRLVAWRGKPFSLRLVFFLHNAFLALGSLLLFVPLVYDVASLMYRHGVWEVFCDPQGHYWHGRHYWLYYLNYVFKFIELADTLLLALRGKPLLFLHVYHHAATLLLCFTQLRAQSCMQFVPIAINLLIHVLMYSYYALATLKVQVWWKRYLTMAQIVQFVVGLIACVVGLGSLTLYHNGVGSAAWGGYKCHGEFSAAYFGIGILASPTCCFSSSSTQTRTGRSRRRGKRKQRKSSEGGGGAAMGRGGGGDCGMGAVCALWCGVVWRCHCCALCVVAVLTDPPRDSAAPTTNASAPPRREAYNPRLGHTSRPQ